MQQFLKILSLSLSLKRRTQRRGYPVSVMIVYHHFFHPSVVRDKDKRVERDDEFSDSEDEGDERRDTKTYKEPSARKRPRLAKDSTPSSAHDKKPSSSPAPPNEEKNDTSSMVETAMEDVPSSDAAPPTNKDNEAPPNDSSDIPPSSNGKL